jgi:glycerophosphoryl diester phosphodiesterase
MGAARPLVIAHRGASGDVAEHTLEAYQLAIEVGADGLECDVRLTRDGQLVCIHDRTLERTSTGTGSVSSRRLADLQRLDFGSWHGGRPASVLTLAALLELVHDTPGPPRLLIETKHPTRYGGQVEQALVALLERFGWTGAGGGPGTQPVTVMSFAERALGRVHRRAPGLPTVLLMDTSPGLRQTGLLPESVEIAGPGIDLVRSDPGYVERAHLLGNQVYVWTVDDPDDLRLVRELGVEAIITNRPAATLAALTGPV